MCGRQRRTAGRVSLGAGCDIYMCESSRGIARRLVNSEGVDLAEMLAWTPRFAGHLKHSESLHVLRRERR